MCVCVFILHYDSSVDVRCIPDFSSVRYLHVSAPPVFGPFDMLNDGGIGKCSLLVSCAVVSLISLSI